MIFNTRCYDELKSLYVCVLSSDNDGSDEECCISFILDSSELLVSSLLTPLEDLGGMLKDDDSNEEFEDVNFEVCSFNLNNKWIKII